MKSNFLRPIMLLAVALGLSACGGGKATFDIKGTVSGLVYEDLQLTELKSGAKLDIAPAATSFRFPNTIEYGTVFQVAVTRQPKHQVCLWSPTLEESAGLRSEINISVQCNIATHAIGGKITGDATGLELVNGSEGKFTVTSKDVTSFSFTGIPYGTSYGIAILKQPANKVCTLSGAPRAGTMGDTDVEINVTCP